MALAKTPVSRLQEFTAFKKSPLPEYSITSIGSSGLFQCTVNAENLRGIGTALNKKEAKHNAAQNLLEQLGETSEQEEVQSKDSAQPVLQENYISALNNLVCLPYPVYEEFMLPNGTFKVNCQFSDFKTSGSGPNKKSAKQQAAKIMFETLESSDWKKERQKSNLLSESEYNHIINKFNGIKTSLITNSDKNNNNNINFRSQLEARTEELGIDIISYEDFETKMIENNLKISVETFQRSNPVILQMNFRPSQAILMGIGKTRDEALKNILMQATVMLRSNFDFYIKEFLK